MTVEPQKRGTNKHLPSLPEFLDCSHFLGLDHFRCKKASSWTLFRLLDSGSETTPPKRCPARSIFRRCCIPVGVVASWRPAHVFCFVLFRLVWFQMDGFRWFRSVVCIEGHLGLFFGERSPVERTPRAWRRLQIWRTHGIRLHVKIAPGNRCRMCSGGELCELSCSCRKHHQQKLTRFILPELTGIPIFFVRKMRIERSMQLVDVQWSMSTRGMPKPPQRRYPTNEVWARAITDNRLA